MFVSASLFLRLFYAFGIVLFILNPVSDTSPFIIDEESGIVYSPSLKRSDSMAQRLREMRAQREHLSPTGIFSYCATRTTTRFAK